MNRMIWIVVFGLGAATFAWIEWHSEAPSAMGWFIETSIWSAVCGIGFTVCDWAAGKRRRAEGDSGPERRS
jgi:hypothetical protein